MTRMRTHVGSLLLGSLLVVSCGPTPGEETRSRKPSSAVMDVKTADSVMIVAAGDIARGPQGGRETAALIGRIAPDAVLTLGDNAYEQGTLEEYRSNYEPSWGRFRSITRPVPGNHDYETPDGKGYFDYFKAEVHGNEYYAWTAGRWRMYALNCEIDCGSDSSQLQWLRRDLSRHPGPSLAYVHEPRFTCSTVHPPLGEVRAVWASLQRADGRIMLAGHNHAYERFAMLNADGAPTQNGLRQFVVGTGGASSYPVRRPCPSREAQNDRTAGVLKLVLKPDSYTWQFIAVDGRVLDEGRADPR